LKKYFALSTNGGNLDEGKLMSSLKEFMDEAERSSGKALPSSNTTLPAIQIALTGTVSEILTPFSIPQDEQQKFSEEISTLVQNKAFLSEFGDKIGEPLEYESEDEFVKRSSDTLRQMLYEKFDIKS
jgi:hypothetical protein